MKFAVFFGDVTVDESRAFCPTGVGGGIDNSCSSKGGGSGPSPKPPASPKPDGKVAEDDARGAVTGHSREQRDSHASDLAKWLRDTHGVDMAIDEDTYLKAGPPTVDSMRQVADGIAHLERKGITLPKTIVFSDLPGNAPAGYDYISGTVMVDPDTSLTRIQDSIEKGWLAGTLSSESWGLMVHEMSHHDHRESIRQKIADRSAITDDEILTETTIGRVKDLMGMPRDGGPESPEPWDPGMRFGTTARRPKDEGNDALPSNMAREAAREVSEYAATNPLEFVAEVRTGLVAGITYSDRVMQLYEDYGGPPPPKRRRAA